MNPQLARRTGVMAAVTVFAAILVGPPAVLLAAAALLGGGMRARRRRTRDQARLDASLPDSLEMFVLLLHAGRAPAAAVRDMVELSPPPLIPAWEAVVHRLERGRSFADALDELPRVAGPLARPVAEGIAAAERYGTELVPTLERLSGDIRDARRRAAEADARALAITLSFPLVLCTLPAFVLLAIVPAIAGAISSIRGIGP